METSQSTTATSRHRVFIACARCKVRKRKCDGGAPRCSNCAANDAECSYAEVRKRRGPGKKQKASIRVLEGEPASGLRTINEHAQSIVPTVSGVLSPAFPKIQSIFPDPLLPGTFKHNLEAFKTELGKAKVNKDFYPLIPLSLARQLIQNSYAGVLGAHAFIRLPDLLELLDAQYNNENPMEPGDNPGRWAVVNAVVALSVRFKTAAGAELEFSPVAMSGYHNATMVVHSLILQAPSLLTIQALLAMALFARGIPDQQAFVMLATNASSQFEIWRRLRWKGEAMAMMLNMEETVADALVGSVAARLLEEANSFMV